ncbi:lysylphosphatidylglycerol synthase domain-containing protein [Georgenia sp. Z1344]|uniref:lysylphosphatidylglycerol synthase domain-containing protein n=1 Tax=Georgenia sp. Z1344 TaxID=3416706 RepID=UPI003CF680DB
MTGPAEEPGTSVPEATGRPASPAGTTTPDTPDTPADDAAHHTQDAAPRAGGAARDGADDAAHHTQDAAPSQSRAPSGEPAPVPLPGAADETRDRTAITAVTPDEDGDGPQIDPVSGRPVYLRTPVPPPTARAPRREVLLVDALESRVRRPVDLLRLFTAVLGLALVLVLAVYARGTTLAVTEDVQDAVTGFFRQLFQLPVTALGGLLTFFVPIAVLAERAWRRRWRSALQGLVAGALGVGLALGSLELLDALTGSELFTSLTITSVGRATVVLSPFIAGLAGVLTAVGPATTNRVARWSWNLLWVVLALEIIQGAQTLPGAIIAVLLGAIAGYTVRYVDGVTHERADGTSLVRGLRRAGIDAVSVIRMDRPSRSAVAAYTVTTEAPLGYIEPATPGRVGADTGRTGRTGRTDDDAAATTAGMLDAEEPPSAESLMAAVDAAGTDTIRPDPVTDVPALLERVGSEAHPARRGDSAPGRQYAVWDTAGARHDLRLLDGDRQVVGLLSSIWEAIRLRGIDRRPVTSLKDAAGRTSLMSLAATAAGVRTPAISSVTTARNSVLVVEDHVDEITPIDEVPAEDLQDDVLDDVWRQLRRAHAAGLTHRDLTTENVLVDGSGAVWLVGWEAGEVASTELSRRMDLAQTLALLGVVAGPERALASAGRALTREQMAAVAPVLQRVALPVSTRQELRRSPQLLGSLRDTLVALVPTADVPPIQLARFSVSRVVMTTLLLVVVYVLITSLNFQEVWTTLTSADPTLMAIAYVLGLATYIGAAMSLMAFSPNRLPFGQTVLAQAAGAIVALVAPAGIGPAAVNMRFLAKHKVSTPLAVASVALVQVFQFVATILLLVLVGLTTGSVGTLSLPSGSVLWGAGAVIVVVAVALAVPPVRRWVWSKTAPTIKQIGPRIMWLVSSPQRLIVGVSGNLLLTAFYVATFGFCLAAYGESLPLTTLALTYLVSNSVGALIPSPGGIGPVEAALTGGLTVAGIPPATALSVALLYRLLTMWGRVPIGWGALTYLRRKNLV